MKRTQREARNYRKPGNEKKEEYRRRENRETSMRMNSKWKEHKRELETETEVQQMRIKGRAVERKRTVGWPGRAK